MTRIFSLFFRKLSSIKDRKRNLTQFNNWKIIIDTISTSTISTQKKVLIIRLDDIGDSLFFRNCLQAYKSSPKWKEYEISLLGNIAWKNLYDALDKDFADKTIWVDKNKYFSDYEN